ncbi:MAG: lysine--tRNA ligase [Leptospiraceae bacterium]|nr:lysine--tRNA ligase [Leptospiraceae bacterium]
MAAKKKSNSGKAGQSSDSGVGKKDAQSSRTREQLETSQSTPASAPAGADVAVDSSDLYENRVRKLRALQEEGRNPYSQSYHPEHQVADLLKVPADKYAPETIYSLGGRLRSRRLMGKAAFLDLEDASGRMQLYASNKDESVDFELIKNLDLGDVIGVEGYLFTTKTGQTTLHVTGCTLLAKCLRPLPVVKEADGQVFDAFSDREQRYRMRYVDLIVNPDVRDTFMKRSRIISSIRSFLNRRGYLEVETPMMHPIPGGAAARPFVTHHNTLDMDLYLRIAPELYLKRLIVGGFPRVFEINRNFRNEGISIKHNPEFTMLELYEAFGDMESMLRLCEELITSVTNEICGSLQINYGGQRIDLSPPWRRVTYADIIAEHSGVHIAADMNLTDVQQAARKAGCPEDEIKKCGSIWQVAELLFDEKVESKLIQPVFITDYPVELSPLARAYPDRPEFVQRFEPYIVGREIGNAFSELNDPAEQRMRFEEQVRAREAGWEEGGYMDHDYVRALEYGMPPTGGMGIGIDRLVMLLTDSASIRDTILFPQLRPRDLAHPDD